MRSSPRTYAVFWWSLAWAFEVWLIVESFALWFLREFRFTFGEGAACWMDTWERVPDWRRVLYFRLDDVGEWLAWVTPVLLALLTWRVVRHGTAKAQVRAAGVGIAALVAYQVLQHVRVLLLPDSTCPEFSGASWEAFLPTLLVLAGGWAGSRPPGRRPKPHPRALPRWMPTALAVVVLAGACCYGYLNSDRLLGRCSYDWDGPSDYIPFHPDEIKILGRGCDDPALRARLWEQLELMHIMRRGTQSP
ncbi:hypothetical protein [Nonomuraea sp. LPB2021202275-12-8]|uniref:hypothetical protein n=1 Tax=Nonomuraea sp. LPB2021202275-12-8 TaxID=3120159 RepID=UPI00300D04B6